MRPLDSKPNPVRRVTREYVCGVLVFALAGAVSLTIAAWGLGSFFWGVDLAAPGSPLLLIPFSLVLIVLGCAVIWWRMALILLRGKSAFPWFLCFCSAGFSGLVIAVFRVFAGLDLFAFFDVLTWFAVLSFGFMSAVFWAVLYRRVYTAKQRPLWPWERRDKRELELAHLQEMWDRS